MAFGSMAEKSLKLKNHFFPYFFLILANVCVRVCVCLCEHLCESKRFMNIYQGCAFAKINEFLSMLPGLDVVCECDGGIFHLLF